MLLKNRSRGEPGLKGIPAKDMVFFFLKAACKKPSKPTLKELKSLSTASVVSDVSHMSDTPWKTVTVTTESLIAKTRHT